MFALLLLGKIAKSVFLLIRHLKYSAILSRILFFRLLIVGFSYIGFRYIVSFLLSLHVVFTKNFGLKVDLSDSVSYKR